MVYPSLRREKYLQKKGFKLIAGTDEAGRGPLAGPVVAAAVILPPNFKCLGIKDSKLLSPAKRLRCYEVIRQSALCFSYAVVSHKVIDKINILEASLLAMRQAVAGLGLAPDYLLVDGRNKVEVEIPEQTIIKGDTKVMSITAAGIIAKVVRDNIMLEFHRQYPKYNFAKHKGYGTREHLAGIREHGASPIHRRTFRPLTGLGKVAKISNKRNKAKGGDAVE